MSGEPYNSVLQLPRRMDSRIDRIVENVRNRKVRLAAVEEGMAALNRRVDRMSAALRTER
jgi:hypothetical protein